MKPTKAGENVLFDQETGSYYYIGSDGIEYIYDQSKHAWFAKITDEVVNQQQSIYKVDGIDENATVEKPGVKRKREKQQGQPEKKKKPKAPRKNTAVYVTGIPSDATIEEVEELFKKAGVIFLDPQSSKPKIKLYEDEKGELKGDALVIYLREESVTLACQLFDDSPFRLGSQTVIKVQPAVFQDKPEKEKEVIEDPAEKKLRLAALEKMHKYERPDNRQLEWDEEQVRVDVKNQKSVVLKHMFTIKELDEDPTLLLDLKQDVREECQQFGPVTSVALYDLEENGVMLVRFKTPEAAESCIQKMNGRYFDGRKIEASHPVKGIKFKKSHKGNDEEEKQRQEEYGKWLDSQEL